MIPYQQPNTSPPGQYVPQQFFYVPQQQQPFVQMPYQQAVYIPGSPGGTNSPIFGGPSPVQVMFIPSTRNQCSRENPFGECGLDDVAVRNGFIRKVYLILFAQLSLTGCFITMCMLIPAICMWIKQHPLFTFISYGIFFSVYLALMCFQNLRRNFPGNFVALLVFTLAFAYMASAVTCAYSTISVLTTVVITAVTCLMVSIFAVSTCVDFTRCTALFMVMSIGLFLFGIACIFVYYFVGHNKILHTVYGGIAACVFMLYLAYDTQMIVGGRSHEISPEEYIYGAMQLYVDVMYLFLILLGLTGDQD